MNEKIGNVILDLSKYTGEDLYSDGEIEDRILEIVKEKKSYHHELEIYKDWALYYHLSRSRENIINWYPFEENQRILEIGAGCGAISGAFLKKDCQVTCCELSKRRSLINAYRHRNSTKLEIKVGNFDSLEINDKFDYATLIGVLEYAKCFFNSDEPYVDMLRKAKLFLKNNGKLIIAIENKFGLKYWSGCKEDHTGLYFESIENYSRTDGAHTFSKKELEVLLDEAGYKKIEFYYPYPDYKFADHIFSDSYLPKHGELIQNQNNFDQDRITLFDEGKAFDNIVKSGYFPEFSNSFLIIAENGEEK